MNIIKRDLRFKEMKAVEIKPMIKFKKKLLPENAVFFFERELLQITIQSQFVPKILKTRNV